MASAPQHPIDPTQLVNGKYQLGKLLGSGAFGEIYRGKNVLNDEEVAVKMESFRSRSPKLFHETNLYKVLAGGPGIPRVRWSGRERDYYVMVMDYLGPSLEELFIKCGRRFTLKTVLLLADQMLRIFEYVHSKNIIHRDIKPENFLMELHPRGNRVFLIDLGLAKQYHDARTREHIPFSEGKNGLIGTSRYASINAHLKFEQSRRDDMEALGYVFVYLLRGGLPWQGITTSKKTEKYEQVRKMKMSIPIETLCHSLPTEFAMYLNYCRGLEFKEAPDYMYWRQMFRILYRNQNYEGDHMFDWQKLEQEAALSTNGDEDLTLSDDEDLPHGDE